MTPKMSNGTNYAGVVAADGSAGYWIVQSLFTVWVAERVPFEIAPLMLSVEVRTPPPFPS